MAVNANARLRRGYSGLESGINWPNGGFLHGVGKISMIILEVLIYIQGFEFWIGRSSTANHLVPSSFAYACFNSLESGIGAFPFIYKLSLQRLLELAGVPVYNGVLPEMYTFILGSSRSGASERSFKQELNQTSRPVLT